MAEPALKPEGMVYDMLYVPYLESRNAVPLYARGFRYDGILALKSGFKTERNVGDADGN